MLSCFRLTRDQMQSIRGLRTTPRSFENLRRKEDAKDAKDVEIDEAKACTSCAWADKSCLKDLYNMANLER